jgi:hypothetical protein
MPNFDLSDEELFGNEAAEDEDEDVFVSHLFLRNDLSSFLKATNPIKTAVAYKGQGKSSLLRSLETSSRDKEDEFVIRTTGGAISPEVSGHDAAKWAKAWKRELYKLIAVKFGAEIGFAWNDDSIGLVEEAEKEGFRKRSIFSAIFDRMSAKATISGGGSAELARTRIPTTNHEQVLQRYLRGGVDKIWLVVDDIDRNFKGTKSEKAKIVGFFDAVRDMRNSIPQLRVRTSIRPNVFASVKLDFESISHVRQYMVYVSWSEDQIRGMLAKRIEGYLQRTGQSSQISPVGTKGVDLELIAQLFESPVPWGLSKRPIHVALYTLSAGRPRWLVELCKRAARRAFERNAQKIRLDDVRAVMDNFGIARKEDLIAEFGAQCPQLSDMFDAFHGKQEIYTTSELYDLIEREVLSKFTPNISGLSGRPRAEDIASYLFEVGLFHARRALGEDYEHVAFHDWSNAFKSTLGMDEGVRWEIHPAFRTVLGLRNNRYSG